MDELVEKLRLFGLNVEESRLLVCLASNGPKKASELGILTEIDRVKTYRCLKKMQSLGLVETTFQKPTLYMAVPISEALDILMYDMKKKVEKCIDEKAFILSEINLNKQKLQTNQIPRFKIIQGREQFLKIIAKSIANARVEINNVTTKNGLIRAMNSEVKEALEQSAKKGVKIKYISEIDNRESNTVKEVEKIVELRGMNLPQGFRMTIIDGKEAIISSISDDSTNLRAEKDITIWTNDTHIAYALDFFFKVIWQTLPQNLK